MRRAVFAVFKLRISQYINKNLVEKELTYKQLAECSGVPASSIHSYAQGKTGNPNEDNLIRIAAAFGDPPEVIAAMRRESIETTAKENVLIAKADDKELMEKHAALIRESVSQILDEYRAASAAQKVVGTVKRATPRGAVLETVDRRNLWEAQTPQIFHVALYSAALKQLKASGYSAVTDDNEIVERMGYRVQLVECSKENMKITTPEDLPLAEAILESRRGH
jgi:transcriptional regulator with XRE-family HTH domain